MASHNFILLLQQQQKQKQLQQKQQHEIPHILWNPKAHYCVHKWPLPAPTLSHKSRSEAYPFDCFITWYIFMPNPQAGGPPLVGCLRSLIQYIRSYSPYWRAFLHMQPEDAPCHGDTDCLITGSKHRCWNIHVTVYSLFRTNFYNFSTV
jgi:hypothetical protein